MIGRQQWHVRRLAPLCGILLGIVACSESPTGIPDNSASRFPRVGATTDPQQTCYLINGQPYCVGVSTASADSSGANP